MLAEQPVEAAAASIDRLSFNGAESRRFSSLANRRPQGYFFSKFQFQEGSLVYMGESQRTVSPRTKKRRIPMSRNQRSQAVRSENLTHEICRARRCRGHLEGRFVLPRVAMPIR
jgi:hypothetical protein